VLHISIEDYPGVQSKNFAKIIFYVMTSTKQKQFIIVIYFLLDTNEPIILGCSKYKMQANQNPTNVYLSNCQNVVIGDSNVISSQSSPVQGRFTTEQRMFQCSKDNVFVMLHCNKNRINF
jgi:hypothetical protein